MIRFAYLRRFTVRTLAAMSVLAFAGPVSAQEAPSAFIYPVKFLCGPSSEVFQEGIVAGFAATAVNILNPSSDSDAPFTKWVARALPYRAAGPISEVAQDSIGPLGAIEIECNEIRQMLPSQMTEEFRTGYLVIRSKAELVLTAVYSARPRNGEISTLDVQRVMAMETGRNNTPTQPQPDLTIADIDIGNLRVDCPRGQGSCITLVPVTVSNIGAADAGPFRVRVRFDPNQSVVVDTDLAGLAAGASQTLNIITKPSNNCYDPDCRICAVADSEAAVAESNESNNDLCRECQG
jgi:hypothetical protein